MTADGVTAREACGFFVPADAIGRLQLLELTAFDCPNGREVERGRFRPQ